MITAIAVILSVTSFAQDGKGVKFTDGTLTEIRQAAAKANKLIFVDIYTVWCGPCKFLSSDIFPKESVGKFMNEKFINAKFDAEKGEGIEIAKAFDVKGYPTMLILDKDGKEQGRIVGAERTPEAFIEKVKSTLAKIADKK